MRVPAPEAQASGFAAFVDAESRGLLRSAYLLTGNRDAAEDLVQDTFVRLYPRWHRVEAADNPLAYVRRSLVNGFLNTRRSPSRREVPFDVVPDTQTRDFAVGVGDRDFVWHLLDSLPDRQRAALVLRYFHDLADTEIAQVLACREGTVRSLVSRGLATLRAGTESR